MSRKSRELREGVEAWKEWEHDRLPMRKWSVSECFQVSNTYVVEARTEADAVELIERNFYADEKLVPSETRTKGKHHHVLGAELVED